MKMPYTNLAVMLPDGKRVSIMPQPDSKTWEVHGLAFGPLVITRAEAHAIHQLFTVVFEAP